MSDGRAMTISSLVSRASAVTLLAAGLALLFAPDALLSALVPGFPEAGYWIGQVLGAAWLGVASLNWWSRASILGGIYGRPVVFTNFALYFIGAIPLLKAATAGGAPPILWALAGPMAALAVAYGALLWRGPFDPIGKA